MQGARCAAGAALTALTLWFPSPLRDMHSYLDLSPVLGLSPLPHCPWDTLVLAVWVVDFFFFLFYHSGFILEPNEMFLP